MKHKVSELEGALLDAAVAKAEGIEIVPFTRADGSEGNVRWSQDRGCHVGWNPSTDWRDGGPIIERDGISVSPTHGRISPPRITADVWRAYVWLQPGDIRVPGEGPTPLIAAMRAKVAGRYGEWVELPD